MQSPIPLHVSIIWKSIPIGNQLKVPGDLVAANNCAYEPTSKRT